MLQKSIDEIGKAAFARMITPLKKAARFSGELVGFDTEYDSKTAQYICYQLGYDGRGVLVDRPITVDSLAHSVLALLGFHPGEVMLVSYWSLAELQFLPVRESSFGWREYGTGSFDCSFFSRTHKLALHIFDLARFFDRQGLAAVARIFGLEKLEYERTKIHHSDLASPRFREYAINDAIITEQIARRLRAEYLARGVDILDTRTPANTAATVFRLEKVAEPLRNDNSGARMAGMRSVWGGRAEALERGYFSCLWEYDLRSAYPSAAIALHDFPTSENWREFSSLRGVDGMRGLAHVAFDFPRDCRYPCLLVAGKHAQIYPLRGRTWTTLAELALARRMGAHIRLLEGWRYSHGTSILSDFLAAIVEERKGTQGAKKVMLKLLANSLIGKLAQRTLKIDLNKLLRLSRTYQVSLEELFSLRVDEQTALGISPQISVGALFMPEWNALITGYVRAQISDMVARSEAVYVATDAVWTRAPFTYVPSGYDLTRVGPGVVARTRLGMILDDPRNPHIAHHSIWSRRVAHLLLKNIDTPRRYVVKRPIKVREALREGSAIGKWVTEWRRADARWDQKRRLLSDGSTEPWNTLAEYDTVAHDARSAQRKKDA